MLKYNFGERGVGDHDDEATPRNSALRRAQSPASSTQEGTSSPIERNRSPTSDTTIIPITT